MILEQREGEMLVYKKGSIRQYYGNVPEKQRPAVLINPLLYNPAFYDWMGLDWAPMENSQRITGRKDVVEAVKDIEYSKDGRVRLKLKNGEYRLVKLNRFRFMVDGFNVYMPKGEICVGNGEKSYRFDSFKEATYFMGFDVARAYKTKIEVGTWRVEKGWPMPFVLGKSWREEEYVGQFAEMRKASKNKGAIVGGAYWEVRE